MSAIPPTGTSSPRAELLGKFVPTSIERIPPMAHVRSPFRVTLMGLISMGILPLLNLRSRIEQATLLEVQQLELASELIECHRSEEIVKPLRDIVRDLPTPAWLRAIGHLSVFVALAAVVAYFFKNDWSHEAFRRAVFPVRFGADGWLIGAFAAVSLSYAVVALQLERHVNGLRRFAAGLNSVPGITDPLPIPTDIWRGHVVYWVIGIGMLAMGMTWGAFMMATWGAFVRFAEDSDMRFRSELSRRLQTISGVKPVIRRAGLCPHPRCDQVLPDNAHFCPRCGRSVDLR